MNNSKNILYLISLMLLLLTGCEAEAPIAPLSNNGEEPVEVRFHAVTVGADVMVSRANYTATTLEDKIGMWGGTYQNIELKYTKDTTPNLSTADNSTIYYPLQAKEMPVYAYAPYSTTAYNYETNTVKVKSNWMDELNDEEYITDPLWAGDTITRNAPNAYLAFKHQMARLQIYLVHPNEEKCLFYNLTLNFDRLQHGEMSLATGEITSTPSVFSRSLNARDTELKPESETTVPHYDYTILPGSKLTKINVILFKEDNTRFSYTHEFQTPLEFEGGKTRRMIIDFGEIETQN